MKDILSHQDRLFLTLNQYDGNAMVVRILCQESGATVAILIIQPWSLALARVYGHQLGNSNKLNIILGSCNCGLLSQTVLIEEQLKRIQLSTNPFSFINRHVTDIFSHVSHTWTIVYFSSDRSVRPIISIAATANPGTWLTTVKCAGKEGSK